MRWSLIFPSSSSAAIVSILFCLISAERLSNEVSDPTSSTPTPTCGAGEIYLDCGPICQATCPYDRSSSPDSSADCDARCVAGCFCPPGLLRDFEGRCVEMEECARIRAPRTGDIFECPQADGDYASTVLLCSTSYYRCTGRSKQKLYCTGTEIFCAKTRKCRPLEELPECQFHCEENDRSMHSLGCTPYFWWCHDGLPSKKRCTEPDRYFNPKNGQCDFRYNVEACKDREDYIEVPKPKVPGAKMTTTTTSAPIDRGEVVPTEAPFIDPRLPRMVYFAPVDCSINADGSYANPDEPCADHFYQCANGNAFYFPCGSGLFFDASTTSCVHREDVSACANVAPVTPKPKPSGGKRLYDAPLMGELSSKVAFSYRNIQYNYPLDCSSKKDGAHADPTAKCAGHYYACTHGTATYMPCPATLYYHSGLNQCLRWDDVPECVSSGEPSSTTTTTTTRTTAAPAPLAEDWIVGGGKYEARPSPSTSGGQAFDCSNKADGNYADPTNPCCNTFITCSNGIRIPRPCPSDLFYDSGTDKCLRRDEVPACGGQRPSGGRDSDGGPSSSIYGGITSIASCPKMDGVFAHPNSRCTPSYIVCRGGQWEKTECSTPGHVFDPESKSCMDKARVQGCDTDICIGKETGSRHPAGPHCSSNFITCVHGVAVVQPCPSPLVFSSTTGRCEYAADVPACKIVRVETTYREPDVIPPSEPHQPWKPQPPPPVVDGGDNTNEYPGVRVPEVDGGQYANPAHGKASCQSIPDGDYEMARCSNQYRSCGAGNEYPRSCPADLVFDGKSKRCENPRDVAGCGGNIGGGASADRYPGGQVVTGGAVQAPSGIPAPHVGKTSSCQSIPDGDYELGPCSNQYRSCGAGNEYVRSCPNGLVFDGTQKRCETSQNVAGCGKIDVGGGAYPTLEPIPSSTPRPYNVTIAEGYCLNLADGFYQMHACSSDSIQCQKGQSRLARCIDGDIFDGKSCKPAARVPACTGAEVNVGHVRGGREDLESFPPQLREWYRRYLGRMRGVTEQPGATGVLPIGDQEFDSLPPALREWYRLYLERRALARGQFVDISPTQGKTDRSPYDDTAWGEGEILPDQERPGSVFPLPPRGPDYGPSIYVPSSTPSTIPEPTRKPYDNERPPPHRRRPDHSKSPVYGSSEEDDEDYYGEDSICRDKAEGWRHAVGPCSTFYNTCHNRRYKTMQCPDGRAFDRYTSQCQVTASVRDCNSTTTSGSAMARPPPMMSVGSFYNGQKAWCMGQPDGSYPKGECTSEYVKCQAGRPIPAQCQYSRQVFHPYRRRCEPSANVTTCFTKPPTQHASSPNYHPERPSSQGAYDRRPYQARNEDQQQPRRPSYGPTGSRNPPSSPIRPDQYEPNRYPPAAVVDRYAGGTPRPQRPGPRYDETSGVMMCPFAHEEYSKCGTACEATCSEPRPQECQERCVAGCHCQPGYVRAADDRCVLAATCNDKTDVGIPVSVENVGEPLCTKANEIFMECSNCAPTCAEPKPECEKERCKRGCACRRGYIRAMDGRCVPEQFCLFYKRNRRIHFSSERSSDHSCNDGHGHKCDSTWESEEKCTGAYERYSKCGAWCQPTCFRKDKDCDHDDDRRGGRGRGRDRSRGRGRDGHRCVPGCVCLDGHYRSHTGVCVPNSQCGAVPPPIKEHDDRSSRDSKHHRDSDDSSVKTVSVEEEYKDFCINRSKATYKLGECSDTYIYCRYHVPYVFTCDSCDVFDGNRCVPCKDRKKCRNYCRKQLNCDHPDSWQSDEFFGQARDRHRGRGRGHRGGRHHGGRDRSSSASHEYYRRLNRYDGARHCSSRPDGFYGVSPCRPDYVQCHHGHVHHRKCKVGFVFVEESRRCTPSAQHFACNAAAQMSPPFVQVQRVDSPPPASIIVEQPPPFVVDTEYYPQPAPAYPRPATYGRPRPEHQAPPSYGSYSSENETDSNIGYGTGPLSAMHGKYGSIYPKPTTPATPTEAPPAYGNDGQSRPWIQSNGGSSNPITSSGYSPSNRGQSNVTYYQQQPAPSQAYWQWQQHAQPQWHLRPQQQPAYFPVYNNYPASRPQAYGSYGQQYGGQQYGGQYGAHYGGQYGSGYGHYFGQPPRGYVQYPTNAVYSAAVNVPQPVVVRPGGPYSIPAPVVVRPGVIPSPSAYGSQHTRVVLDVDGICRGRVDGSLVSLGKCKRQYAECKSGLALPKICVELKQIYDDVTKRCINREDEPICRALPPAPTPARPPGDLAQFCLSRPDGYYVHPHNCTKFIQCHRRDTFTFQCSEGLVFNAKEGVKACDYPRNVPECVDPGLGNGIDEECEGLPNGAFLRHPSDCHKYRRCVHGRIVVMDCPDGTVWNHRISVCDWKKNVPECNQ